MAGSWKHWLVVGLVLGTAVYALAEDITLTTYYPSPRGVYQELRTAGNVQIGTIDPPVGTVPRLHVVQDQAAPAFRVDDEDAPGDTTPFVISDTGNVGIGIEAPNPTQKLHVIGDARIEGTVSAQAFGSLSPLIFQVQGAERMRITDAGDIGIGTTSPSASAILDLSSSNKGLLLPRMTSVQRDAIVSPAAGLLLYNTTTNEHNLYTGTAWISVSGPWATSGTDIYNTNTGNVGIGTASPSQKLDVVGQIHASGDICTDAGGGKCLGGMGGFGGMYQLDCFDNSICRVPNPLIGACGCPNGFTSYDFGCVVRNPTPGAENRLFFCHR